MEKNIHCSRVNCAHISQRLCGYGGDNITITEAGCQTFKPQESTETFDGEFQLRCMKCGSTDVNHVLEVWEDYTGVAYECNTCGNTNKG